jgi:hypothetical protein
MKSLSLLVLMGMFASTSFAQDMSQTENYKDAYQEMPDGSSRYVGKCKTHEDKKGKTFKMGKTILKTIYPQEYDQSEVNALVNKIGADLFLKSMIAFFGDSFEVGSLALAKKEFPGLSDDMTVEQILLLDKPEMELIRVNMGYGGGNGGYAVFLMKNGKVVKQLSETGDGSLEFCDKLVWKK